MTETRTAALENATTHQMFLTGIFVAFTVFHLLLFIFYPAVRENLIFSGLTFAAAFMVYFRFENYFITDPSQYITFTHLSFISTMAASLLSLRLVYFLVFESLPRRFYVAAGLAGILTVTIWFIPMALSSYLILFVGLMFLEIMRTIVTVRIRRHRELFEGSWIILLGFIPLSLAAVYKTLVTLEIMDEQITVMDFPLAMYAMLLLLLSVSVFLSRTYARTNRDLLRQLQEVRRLSEENLRQEVERTRLEAENERKRRELEAARDLQISMLPRKLPDIPDLEIAVYMKPATEVGGDYYDFQAGEDNDLTIAFGDATGHGMQAGIMVAASKSLFQTLASMQDLPAMLARISLTLKNMGFSNVFMAMSVARLRGNILEISSAGMPYALVHRAATSDVEEVILKGMPLGSFPDFPYQSKRVELQSGDTVLFMSDGLPELFNERDELLGDEATVALFAEAARKKPAQIIDHLVEAGEKWAGQRAQEDDITFLVMRKS